ncbi:MAG: aromatic hydrocarbon degradation protein [Bacteroidetes bacterium]|nr:MAG: aromatic hydrocarbon degradation protein [Bacteroidota bacterium]
MNKRGIKILFLAVFMPFAAWSGGIVTNTNQSASFIRKPAQDAVIDATGTYYNPAGLAFLRDGFHLSVSNQTILQNRKVSSTFQGLANTEFEGDVSAPLFPTLYAVYKTGPLALSFGVNPIGGGGTANFEEGLPSFEQEVAILPPSLTAAGINTTAYSMDAAFDGSSLNWGVQLNASYALNEFFAVSLGARFITATNTYKGHLRDIMINPLHPLNANGPGNMVSAPQFFGTVEFAANSAVQQLQPIIDNSAGEMTLNQLVNIGALTQEQADQLAGGLGGIYNPDMQVVEIQTAYAGIAAQMNDLAQATQDRELDAKQTGWGIAPVLGINIRFSDELNMAIKYEHRASITMTNNTTVDDVGMYPDGVEVANDMPSMLSLGLNYRPTRALSLSAGMHYYFDRSADYGKALPNDQIIDNNFIELGFGAEYFFDNGFSISTGYLRTQTGANDRFHSDLSHSLSTNSIGIGGSYRFSPNMAVNFGFMNTMYEAYTKTFNGYSETYDRSAIVFAVGMDFRF